MKYGKLIICFLVMSFVLFSCKNESANTTQNSEVLPKKEKKPLTKKEKQQVKSVLAKAMVTSELKTFVSFLVTTEKANMLATEDGPYTLLAPSNLAFRALAESRMNYYKNPVNKTELTKLVTSHLISGKLDSASLVEKIRENNGSYEIETISGAKFTATKEGLDIFITDAKGVKAQLGKTDINGSNGVLHILNKVLGAN